MNAPFQTSGSASGPPVTDDLPPHDHAGCLWVAVRAGCGMAILYILMAIGIALAALLSLLLFR